MPSVGTKDGVTICYSIGTYRGKSSILFSGSIIGAIYRCQTGSESYPPQALGSGGTTNGANFELNQEEDKLGVCGSFDLQPVSWEDPCQYYVVLSVFANKVANVGYAYVSYGMSYYYSP